VSEQFSSSVSSGRVLRVHVVSHRLGVPRRTVRHWAHVGQLPAVRVGKRAWGFRESDVVAFAVMRYGGRA